MPYGQRLSDTYAFKHTNQKNVYQNIFFSVFFRMFEKHINQLDLMDKTMKNLTLDYAIEIASLTEINHQPLYDEITGQKWSVHYFYDEKRYRNIVIDVVELPHSNAPEVHPTYKLFNQLNSIFQHLHLCIDNDGELCSVVNKKEIQDKWENVRNGLLSEYKGIKQVKKMIEKLDYAYYACEGTLMQSLLHLIFLVRYREENKFEIELPSVLNEGELIDIDLQKTVSERDRQHYCGKGHVHHQSAMKKAYDKQIKPLTQSEFDYDFTIDIEYIFNSEHRVQKIEACIKEQSSDRFVHKKTVTFSLIPKE